MQIAPPAKPLTWWASLVVLSAGVTLALSAASVPASILIGPMLAGIALGLAGTSIQVPRAAITAAQGVVGCLIATSITPEVLGEVVRDWPALLFGVAATIVASSLVGFLCARYGRLPGPVAAWGSAPGAAAAMVTMAGEFGADARLVAVMQYVRVICVVLSASLVSRAMLGDAAATHIAPGASAAPAFDAVGLAATLTVAMVGSWLGRVLRVPAGGLLVPLVIGAALTAGGVVHLSVPTPLLALAYAGIGWAIGLQFERASLSRSLRALPEIALASLGTVALCAGAAWVMVEGMGFPPLTAYLATSPGGIDTVAIIALAGGADTAFVMALQTLRVLAVVASGPAIARLIARTTKRAGRRPISGDGPAGDPPLSP